MRIRFTDNGKWVLPKSGNLGTKAQNLLNNQKVIESNGFKIPGSLVIPYEYMAQVPNSANFVLEQIDRYFSGWGAIYVRSNAPDEDFKGRTPGLYKSERLWHNDRNYCPVLIENVLDSYHSGKAKSRRKTLSLPDLGMCLLIQKPAADIMDSSMYAGCFSDIGELALLTLVNHAKELEAMNVPPLSRNYLEPDGTLKGEVIPHHQELAYKLKKLSRDLPHLDGKGWEIEFVGNRDNVYVVQTTPIHKSERVEIPNNIENIIKITEVAGSGRAISEGVLWVPMSHNRDDLIEFDRTHSNYCLVTAHQNITTNAREYAPNILDFLVNPNSVLDMIDRMYEGYPFAPHVEQLMREGKVAIAGVFTKGVELKISYTTPTRRIQLPAYDEIAYSPARLLIAADEVSQTGIVSIIDAKEIKFTPLSAFKR